MDQLGDGGGGFPVQRGPMGRRGKQPLVIEGLHQYPAFGLLADTVQAHGIKALKDVPVFSVLRGVALFCNKALNLLKTRNDAFLLKGVAACRLGAHFNTQLGQKGVVFIGKRLIFSHCQPPASCASGTPRLQPSSSPTDRLP